MTKDQQLTADLAVRKIDVAKWRADRDAAFAAEQHARMTANAADIPATAIRRTRGSALKVSQ